MEEDRDQPWNFHTCRLCPYRSKSTFLMCKHVRLHSTRLNTHTFVCNTCIPELRGCELCEFETNSKVRLHEHYRVYHAGKKSNYLFNKILECYKCDNCNFQSHSMLFLTKHAVSCVQWYKCDKCCYKSKDKIVLKCHAVKVHPESENWVKSGDWFKCAHCTFKSKLENNVQTHMWVKHTEPKKWYSCGHCSFKSIEEDNLAKHFLIHTLVEAESLKLKLALQSRHVIDYEDSS